MSEQQATFHRFFEEHSTKAYRTAFILTRDHFLAEDIVQESFFRAYKFRSRLRSDEPFGPWFAKIVLNVARTFYARRRVDSPMDLAEEMPALSAAIGAADLRVDLALALNRLDRRQLEVILLRYYLDYSETQMAEALAVPKGTIKSRLSHARQRLAEVLDQAEQEVKVDVGGGLAHGAAQ